MQVLDNAEIAIVAGGIGFGHVAITFGSGHPGSTVTFAPGLKWSSNGVDITSSVYQLNGTAGGTITIDGGSVKVVGKA
ncbi:hypothetical protein [Burkholderia sp. HI2714]|uniref:hypothetical protein n=1 Tax=Burkholderia sp. HI2714 TaxID=2015359 RepID=UPI00117CDED7|nr:hypothetical protein [Burkholderia sp. HI2714]